MSPCWQSEWEVYLDFYDLKREPFCLTPDPRFLHLADPHRNALVSLAHGVLRRRGFMVATGPVGTGKTMLLNSLLHLLSNLHNDAKRKLVSAFLVNPVLNRDEFLESLLDEFELQVSSTSKPRRLLAIRELFLEAQSKGGTAVLIVDEAHLLTVELLEEIRLLTNMDTHREKLLQVVLCGQPELATLLLQPQLRALRQRIVLQALLRPLNADEMRSYIEQRMRIAGLQGTLPFSVAALEEIYRRTQGVPRLINVLCDNCLSIALQMHHKNVDVDFVRAAVFRLTLAQSVAAQSPSNGSGATAGSPTAEPHAIAGHTVYEETNAQRRVAGGRL
jgi:general secretion pathway protein A